MAKQTIALGASANDGTGTDLRSAGDMINDNFDELYAQVAMVKLSEVVTTASQSTISFTSISGSYRHLLVKFCGRGTQAATFVALYFRLNNDSGSNYDYQATASTNTTPTSFQSLAAAQGFICDIPAASATASVSGGGDLDILDYAGTTFQKTANNRGARKIGTASGNFQTFSGSNAWRSTAAITRVDLILSAGAFVDGSIASLYALT